MSKTQQKHVEEIGKMHKLDMIVLHGSQATGKSVTKHPDIDIALYRRGGIHDVEYQTIHLSLLRIFGDDLDLKTLHKKEPLFLYHVMRDGMLLFGNRTFFEEYQAYAYRRYLDAKRLFALNSILVRKKLSRLKQHYAI